MGAGGNENISLTAFDPLIISIPVNRNNKRKWITLDNT